MGLSVENICGLIIRSRLHPADTVKNLYGQFQAEVPAHKASVRQFCRWLVQRGHLTQYQAALIENGYADNFFLDQYKILERIGKGRMAGVYRAVHTTTNQVVAIKVLPPSRSKDQESLTRFQREARLATQLNHPMLVRAFDSGEAGGLHYLVMEHLEGETLDKILKERGRLSVVEAARIGFLAAMGLQYLNDKGMVHRDIKPGNLMLTPGPSTGENTLRSRVKIMDLGQGLDSASTGRANHVELTNDGVILGTPEYVAPEQARNSHQADIRSDIYSLGCTLYHALTGRPPFREANPVQLILKHTTEAPRSLRERQAEIPESLNQIVLKMLAKDPAQRYQKPSQVADALKVHLSTEPDPVKSTDPAELNQFIEWLKKPKPAKAASPAGGSSPQVPAAFALPQTTAKSKAVLPSVARLRRHKDRRRRQRSQSRSGDRPHHKRAKPPVINVEAVSLNDLMRAPMGLPIPRDLFMILTGAFSVLLIVAVLFLVNHIYQTTSETTTPQDEVETMN
jgi:serine/threonine protein kinase